MYAGSAFHKEDIATWIADHIEEFVLYKTDDMLSGELKDQIYDGS